MPELFEQASRLKLRFDTPKGALSPEDLWDLPLSSTTGKANLNEIAVGLHRKLQDATPVSFVDTAAAADPTIQMRFDVVKHVIDVRLAENRAAAEAQDKARRKQQIMGLIARKQDAELEGKSVTELEELLAGL